MDKIKECVIISGKGGTGKTSLTAALASLFTDKIVADCDVDAANLHMILVPDRDNPANRIYRRQKSHYRS